MNVHVDTMMHGWYCFFLIYHKYCRFKNNSFFFRCLSDFNECDSNPCLNSGTCEDGVNKFICHCLPGYGGWVLFTIYGKYLEKITTSVVTCDLFSGTRCETNIDECGSNPCQHGGTCIDKLNAYKCECISGYTGKILFLLFYT